MKLPPRPVVDAPFVGMTARPTRKPERCHQCTISISLFGTPTRAPLAFGCEPSGYSSGAPPGAGAKTSDRRGVCFPGGVARPQHPTFYYMSTEHQGRAWRDICGRRVFN
ncbi:hypothetical protein BV22DRAFT_175059 [Leucogyrophana mollusca]|uniref:Uncharacterized protein n=1 Tax=Leucogyrophana mollusca TaxID=85980 RepID=A0ACB8BUA4_9AGAM|nr:hypothetical protein BV22DRAFT_175059 [Leucogyrophana mollusca]